MTHKFHSTMLTVRRPGITDALIFLEGQKAIRTFRGRIVILDRKIIEQIADGAYGVAEEEYRRLLTLLPDVNSVSVMPATAHHE